MKLTGGSSAGVWERVLQAEGTTMRDLEEGASQSSGNIKGQCAWHRASRRGWCRVSKYLERLQGARSRRTVLQAGFSRNTL